MNLQFFLPLFTVDTISSQLLRWLIRIKWFCLSHESHPRQANCCVSRFVDHQSSRSTQKDGLTACARRCVLVAHGSFNCPSTPLVSTTINMQTQAQTLPGMPCQIIGNPVVNVSSYVWYFSKTCIEHDEYFSISVLVCRSPRPQPTLVK